MQPPLPLPAPPAASKPAQPPRRPPLLSPAALAVADRAVFALTVLTAVAVVIGTHQWAPPSSRELLPVMIESPAR